MAAMSLLSHLSAIGFRCSDLALVMYEQYPYSSLEGFESNFVVTFQDQFGVTKPLEVVD